MLWGYFDESGEHNKSGSLVRLTIGGALAPVGAWEAFSAEWSALLDSAGIPFFHMTDFEAYQKEFSRWTKARHRDFLESALGVIAKNLRAPGGLCLGFTNSAQVHRRTVHLTYHAGLVDAIMLAANAVAYSLEEPIALVFATHPEFKSSDLKKILNIVNVTYPGVRDISTSSPDVSCPLQAADLIAYEIRCFNRGDGSPTNRYPLRRLKELGCGFHFSFGDHFPFD